MNQAKEQELRINAVSLSWELRRLLREFDANLKALNEADMEKTGRAA